MVEGAVLLFERAVHRLIVPFGIEEIDQPLPALTRIARANEDEEEAVEIAIELSLLVDGTWRTKDTACGQCVVRATS